MSINLLLGSHCPPKIMDVLERFRDRVTIDKPVISHSDPVLRLTYTPDPPFFTIRTIIDAICNTSSPSSVLFSASIHHPPSLEARARHMQAKEQRALLFRLAFSVIVAIPTFIIAIVYMSLVPSSNPTRMWFMEPMWAGNASRSEWALLFLATPVMFYSAGMFHRRSLKEIWALWKKRSTPLWKRFVRFGSMNLLVSLLRLYEVTNYLIYCFRSPRGCLSHTFPPLRYWAWPLHSHHPYTVMEILQPISIRSYSLPCSF